MMDLKLASISSGTASKPRASIIMTFHVITFWSVGFRFIFEQVVAEADDAIIHKNIFDIISLNPFEVEDQ